MSDIAASQGSGARAAIGDVGALVGVGYVGQVITLLLSVVLRRILGPTDVASVAVLGLAATYAPYLGLGTLQAAERLLAIEIGRGDEEAAAEIQTAAAAVIGCVSVGFGVAAIVLLATVATGPDDWRAVSAVMATVIVQQVAALAIIRLRTRLRFRAVALTSLATAILTSGGGVLGAAIGGVSGAVLGTVLGYALSAAILVRTAGMLVRSIRG